MRIHNHNVTHSPVVQDNQAAQAHHHCHPRHLSLGPRFCPVGLFDPTGPVRENEFN